MQNNQGPTGGIGYPYGRIPLSYLEELRLREYRDLYFPMPFHGNPSAPVHLTNNIPRQMGFMIPGQPELYQQPRPLGVPPCPDYPLCCLDPTPYAPHQFFPREFVPPPVYNPGTQPCVPFYSDLAANSSFRANPGFGINTGFGMSGGYCIDAAIAANANRRSWANTGCGTNLGFLGNLDFLSNLSNQVGGDNPPNPGVSQNILNPGFGASQANQGNLGFGPNLSVPGLDTYNINQRFRANTPNPAFGANGCKQCALPPPPPPSPQLQPQLQQQPESEHNDPGFHGPLDMRVPRSSNTYAPERKRSNRGKASKVNVLKETRNLASQGHSRAARQKKKVKEERTDWEAMALDFLKKQSMLAEDTKAAMFPRLVETNNPTRGYESITPPPGQIASAAAQPDLPINPRPSIHKKFQYKRWRAGCVAPECKGAYNIKDEFRPRIKCLDKDGTSRPLRLSPYITPDQARSRVVQLGVPDSQREIDSFSAIIIASNEYRFMNEQKLLEPSPFYDESNDDKEMLEIRSKINSILRDTLKTETN